MKSSTNTRSMQNAGR